MSNLKVKLQGVGFDIDPSTGLISKVKMDEIELDVDQKFWFYKGSNGWSDDFSSKASGAYIFRYLSQKFDFIYSVVQKNFAYTVLIQIS